FFFSSRRRHTRFSRDWSSDVCSSDLSVTDHIFPLRKIWRGLYIPLPILGSVYPLLRSTVFRTAEDLKHPCYRELIESVTDVLSRSEERRVGKESRAERGPARSKVIET